MSRYGRLKVFGGILGAVAIVGGLLMVSGGLAGDPPPAGLSAGVSALDVPVVASPSPLPASVERFVRWNAPMLGVQQPAMAANARLLRTGLGARSHDVYAFRVNGAICFVLTDQGGTCSKETGSSSFTWIIGGGDGITEGGALVGIAADDVASIALTVDGDRVPVSLLRNVAYAALPTTAKRAVIDVTHRDGKVTSDNVNVTG